MAFDAAKFREQYSRFAGDPGERGQEGQGPALGRFSDQALESWQPFYNEATGKYRSSRGAEGEYDKPTECPPGMGPSGPSESDPCVPYGDNGGGGEGGGGGGGGQGGQFDNPIYQYLKGQAMNKEGWAGTMLGQGGAAGYQQQLDAARQQAMALPPGPAREAALARLNDPSNLAKMKQDFEGQRMSMLSGQLMPQEYQYGALGENARQANQQNALGWGDLSLRGELGRGNLGLAESAQNWQQGEYFDWEKQRAQEQDALKKWSIQQGQPSKLQTGIGLAGKVAATAGTVALIL